MCCKYKQHVLSVPHNTVKVKSSEYDLIEILGVGCMHCSEGLTLGATDQEIATMMPVIAASPVVTSLPAQVQECYKQHQLVA